MLKMSSFYTCVAKSQWCTVPEIRNGTDKSFSDFGPFFVLLPTHLPPPTHNYPKNQNLEKMKKNAWRYYHFTHVCQNDNHMMWFLRYGAWQTKFSGILDRFWPCYPPNNLKNQNFEKRFKKWKNKTKPNKTKPQILSF